MSNSGKIFFVFLALLFFMGCNITDAQAAGPFEDFNYTDVLALNPDLVTNPKAATIFMQDCSMYPGFLNRIVECIKHMTTYGKIFDSLRIFNYQFSMVTNVALVLYVMFFGLRLSMNVVENVKGEIMVVLITCFFITYVNNFIRMESFIKFFIGMQNEFMNVATISIYTSQKDNPEFKNYACYKNPTSNITSDSIWTRADCLIAYIIGAHPVIERLGPLYGNNVLPDIQELKDIIDALKNQMASSDPDKAGLDDLDVGEKTIYLKPKQGRYTAFSEMSDIYDYSEKACIENAIKTLSTSGSATPTAQDLFKACPNISIAKMQGYLQDIVDMSPRPVKNNLINSTLSYSLIVIMVGMLFNSPAIGIMVFLTGFFIILLMFVAFAQAIFVYLTSLFAILVLGLFAPLILPTILFKQTKQIFQKWIELLFGYTLQPGIVLCYLAFMVYVLQYVISYKSSISLDTADPNADRPHNLIEFHFGSLYTDGDKSPVELFKVMTPTSTGQQGSFGQQLMESSKTDIEGARNDEALFYSRINKGIGGLDPDADKIATEDTSELIRRGFQFKTTGTESKILSVPGFSFFGGNVLGRPDVKSAISRLFFNYDIANSRAERSAQLAQQNAIGVNSVLTDDCVNGLLIKPIEAVPCIVRHFERLDYNLKIAYMQSLLIVLITLCITFVFLNNVMDFAGKLVGIQVTPIGKAMNVYNFTTSKLSRMLKGDVR